MKRFFPLFALVVTLSFALQSQIIFEEGFEGAVFPPTGWTIVDNDGDSYNWYWSPSGAEIGTPHSGIRAATSDSWNSPAGPLIPDNFLISPEIDFTGNTGGIMLSYWVKSEDPSWVNENYQIIVSTTGNTVNNFLEGDIIFEETMETSDYQNRTLNLSAYFGQTIHIAFRHFGVMDMMAITFDDIQISKRTAISGYVYHDINANCIIEPGENGLNGRIVQATPGPFYAETTNDGFYSIMVDSGNYTVSLINNSSLWEQQCPSGPSAYTVNVASTDDTLSGYDFSLIALSDCAENHVDISTWAIRPCFNNFFTVSYGNHGTISSENTTITVELQEGMNYVSGGNLIDQTDNFLTFDVDSLPVGFSGSFTLNIYVDCDMSLLGSTMCISAHIKPDSVCEPVSAAWDHSSVSVDGYCNGDSLACFTIRNTGDPVDGDMDTQSEYRIYENSALVFTGNFQIPGGDSIEICWPAYGNTIRLEADQHPEHPGNSHPNANVEMCGDSLGDMVTGQILPWPQDDNDNFIEIFCLEVTGSYDPNDKQVFPSGITDQYHYIDADIELEYMIRFQNTGSDTAFNIFVMDTISSHLDITTLVSGSSSHPYTVNRIEDNIIQWAFNDVMLPDSNVNEPGSHGFIKYKIQQVPGNIDGTVITNRAGIIFDFNEPIITNTTFNTIGNIEQIVFSPQKEYTKAYNINVYPNPFSDAVIFELNNTNEAMEVVLYDYSGRMVRKQNSNFSNRVVMNRENLSAGLYIYSIQTNKGMICSGRLVVE